MRSRPGLLACAAAVALSLVLFSPAAASAADPPTNGMLSWDTRERASDGYGDMSRRIFEMNPNGSDGIAVTSTDRYESLDVESEFSADGNHLVFTRCEAVLFGCEQSRDLYIVNADGSGERHLTTGTGATWSPDGSQLAFMDKYTFGGVIVDALYVINADGTGRHLLRDPSGCRIGAPAWSPMGDQILYYDYCKNSGPEYPSGWWIVPPNGSSKTLLFEEGYTGECANAGGYDWSPDATKVVLTCATYDSYGPGIELKVLTIASGSLVNITNTPEQPSDGTGQTRETNPSWSPDGQRIAYQRYGDIWTATAAGGQQTNLTNSTREDRDPSWQSCIAGTTLHCIPPAPPPDGDGDGVPDATDSCPAQPGPSDNAGCPIGTDPPDGDSDGVPDAADSCPAQPGPAGNAGCPIATVPPDVDGDGVPDAVDACPTQPGPAGNAGCPAGTVPTDSDGDGVADAADACPTQPGSAANAGCPGLPAASRGDLGITCGTSRISQLDLNADTPAYVLAGAGAQSCFFMVSNRAANELIDLAKEYDGDVARAFFVSLGNPWVRSFALDAAQDAQLEHEKKQLEKQLIKGGLKVLRFAAPRVGVPANAAYTLNNWVKKGGQALTALAAFAIYKGVREDGSCLAFEIYEKPGQPAQFDYDLLLSPRKAAEADADPSVWEHTDDAIQRRTLNLHCDRASGDVVRVSARDTSRVLQAGWATIVVGGGDDSGIKARSSSTAARPDVTSQPDGSVLIGLTAERAGSLTIQLQPRGAMGSRATIAATSLVARLRSSRKVRRGQHVLIRLSARGSSAKRLLRGARVAAQVRVMLRSGRRIIRSRTRVTLRNVCLKQPKSKRRACQKAAAGRPSARGG